MSTSKRGREYLIWLIGMDPLVMKQCVHTILEKLGVRLVTVTRKANHCLSQRTAPHPSPAANQLSVVVNNIHKLHHRPKLPVLACDPSARDTDLVPFSSVDTLGVSIDRQTLFCHFCILQEAQRHPDQMSLDLIQISSDVLGRPVRIVQVTLLHVTSR